LNGREYDLNYLSTPHPLERKLPTSPSTVVQQLVFDLCAVLPKNESLLEWDQCPQGTRACLWEINQKGDDRETDRIVRVIPLATEEKLGVQLSTLKGDQEGLNLVMHGPSYPPAKDDPPNEIVQDQSFDIDIICPPNGADSEAPSFQSYDGKLMKIQWRHQVVCSGAPPDKGGDGSKKTGSGIGYFFIVLLIVFFGYFAIGAYYNYNNYGATGWDLLPHRDFWREVPYLVRDVFSHLCSLGRSRRGYVQV